MRSAMSPMLVMLIPSIVNGCFRSKIPLKKTEKKREGRFDLGERKEWNG
jgi:hypothetical protein